MGFSAILYWKKFQVGENVSLSEMAIDWQDDNDPIIIILPLLGSKLDSRNYNFAKEWVLAF